MKPAVAIFAFAVWGASSLAEGPKPGSELEKMIQGARTNSASIMRPVINSPQLMLPTVTIPQPAVATTNASATTTATQPRSFFVPPPTPNQLAVSPLRNPIYIPPPRPAIQPQPVALPTPPPLVADRAVGGTPLAPSLSAVPAPKPLVPTPLTLQSDPWSKESPALRDIKYHW